MKKQLFKLLRFGFVGVGIAFIYLIGLHVCFQKFHLNYAFANVIAVTVCSVFSYLGHLFITFRVSGNHRKYFPRFALQVIATYIFSTYIMKLFITHAWSYVYAVALVWIVMPIINFLLMQFWTFFNKPIKDAS